MLLPLIFFPTAPIRIGKVKPVEKYRNIGVDGASAPTEFSLPFLWLFYCKETVWKYNLVLFCCQVPQTRVALGGLEYGYDLL